MRTIGIHTRVASFVGAVALLIQISARAWPPTRTTTIGPSKSPSRSGGWPHLLCPRRSPRSVSWKASLVTVLVGSFVGEVLWRQASLNGHVTGLEAMYEVVDGDRSFTALIRGGQNAAGAAQLRRRHPGWVARRRAGGSRVSEVSRYCRDAQLRGRTREQNVFRGNHPRWARPEGLNVRQARTRAPNVGRVLLSRPDGPAGPTSTTRPTFGTVATHAHRARFINTISVLFRSRSNTIRVPSGDTSKF